MSRKKIRLAVFRFRSAIRHGLWFVEHTPALLGVEIHDDLPNGNVLLCVNLVSECHELRLCGAVSWVRKTPFDVLVDRLDEHLWMQWNLKTGTFHPRKTLNE